MHSRALSVYCVQKWKSTTQSVSPEDCSGIRQPILSCCLWRGVSPSVSTAAFCVLLDCNGRMKHLAKVRSTINFKKFAAYVVAPRRFQFSIRGRRQKGAVASLVTSLVIIASTGDQAGKRMSAAQPNSPAASTALFQVTCMYK